MVRTAINVLTKEEQMNLVKISSLTFYINEYPKDIKKNRFMNTIKGIKQNGN